MIPLFGKVLSQWRYLFACVLAVIVPMALGHAIYRWNPSACYDSPCALPLLLVTVPPIAAPVLAVLLAINRRLARPFPDGLLATLLFSGVAVQVAISAFSVWTASPGFRRIFLTDILFIPEGFVTGLVIGAVLRAALHAVGHKAGRGSQQPPQG